MKKTISILGSTGSIGLSMLDIIEKSQKNFKAYIFSANKNYKLICKQIVQYKPKIFIINDDYTYKKICRKFENKNIKLVNNFKKLKLKKKSDITVTAVPGIAGLESTIKMVEKSKKVLIANKESIICGWDIIKNKAKVNNTIIIPVDSEHYSILKLLENEKINLIKKIYITASGGPFLNFLPKQLKKIKPFQALKHPKWKMGNKISIDSATLMNKLFELVEAQKLFKLPREKFEIIIHPNSLVHAILHLKNGLKKIILHDTSMKIPLANALFDGNFDINNYHKDKNLNNFQNLAFKKVNKRIFPATKLIDKISEYPSSAIIINAANEVLVDHFLTKKIAFLDIIKIIMVILKDDNYKKYAIKKPININQIYTTDLWARSITLKKINDLHS